MLQRMSPRSLAGNMDVHLYDIVESLFPTHSMRNRVYRGASIESMPVDVFDKDGEIVVLIDIPGKDEKSLRIELDGMKLTVESTASRDHGQDDGWLIRERPSGVFKRSIKLPVSVDSNKVSSTYINGVLQIVLPKQDQFRVKEIPIN